MPLPQLGIGQAVMLFRRRLRAILVRKCSCSAKIVSSPVFVRRSSPSTPMMSPRSKHSASCPVVADLLLADEELDLAGHVADVDELQLALVAMQHDAAGGADLRARHFAGALFGEPFAEVEVRRRPSLDRAASIARPSCVLKMISLARARMSAIGAWSSNREPHGSWPSSAIVRSLSRRDDSQLPLVAVVAGCSVTVELMRVGARRAGSGRWQQAGTWDSSEW